MSSSVASSDDINIHVLYDRLKTKLQNASPTHRVLFKVGTVIAAITGGLCLRKALDVLYRKWYNYPPGPIGLPFFGCSFWIRDKIYLRSLANCYGSVVMIQCGSSYLTMINRHKLSSTSFTKKQLGFHEIDASQTYRSFVESNGKTYTYRRKLLHESFIMILNTNYLNEVGTQMLQQHIFPIFDEYADSKQPQSVKKAFEYGVFSMNFACIFGEYVQPPSIESSEYRTIASTVSRKSLALSFLYKQTILNHAVTSFLFSKFSNLGREVHSLGSVTQIIQKWVTQFEHSYKQQTHDEKAAEEEEDKTYAVSMRREIAKNKLSLNDMIGDIAMLFATGVGTTNKALVRTVVYAAKYDRLQQKVYGELKACFEKYGRLDFKKHLSEFNLFRAFIYEVLRNGHIVWAVPRTIYDDDVQIGGYNVPRYSLVSSFYGFMDHDSELWKYPDTFDLRNWLDESGKFKHNECSSVFGHGIRKCPGQGLAKRELFSFIAMLLLRYKFSLQDGSNDGDVNTEYKADYFTADSLSVYDTKVRVEKRL